MSVVFAARLAAPSDAACGFDILKELDRPFIDPADGLDRSQWALIHLRCVVHPSPVFTVINGLISKMTV